MASIGKDVVRISTMDPDFEAAPHIKEALIKALQEGGIYTHYMIGSRGLPEFTEAVAQYYSKFNVKYSPSEVLVTPGSGPALRAACTGFLTAGDECIIPDAHFVLDTNITDLLGVKAVFVPLREENNFHLVLDDLRKAVTPKTKMIFITNPNNPTGTVYTEKELRGIADVALEHNLYVLSDEIYTEYLFDNRKHFAIASIDGMKERTIIAQSLSKTFAMTGWRIGWALAHEKLMPKVERGLVGISTPPFIQKAGVAALKGPWDAVNEMRKEYQRRRDYMADTLSKIPGIKCSKPEACLVAWPNIKGTGMSSQKLAQLLLEKGKVAVGAGDRFGPNGEGYLRISFTFKMETLKEGVSRIEQTVKSLVKAKA